MSGSEVAFFAERSVSVGLINDICSVSWRQNVSCCYESLINIMLKYIEQPVLLNPVMMDLMEPLTTTLLKEVQETQTTQNNINDVNDHIHVICKVLQLLCRVRGFKHTIKHFPHKVNHLEMCMNILLKQVILFR
jgi:hypothetical protein